MAKEIELPDGSIAEFPDNMDDAAIRGVLQKKFGAPQQSAQPKQQPDSFLSRAASGFMDPFVGAAQIAEKIPGLPQVRKFLTDSETGMDDVIRQRDAEYNAPEGIDWSRMAGNVANPVTWMGGGATVAPRVAAALPRVAAALSRPAAVLAAYPVAKAAQLGATQSALAPVSPDDNFLAQKAIQAGLGGALGAGVSKVARGFTPTPEAQALMAQGIQPSFGQSMGGVVNSLEQKATSIPFVGDAIRYARNRAQNEFEAAALQRAVGAPAPVADRFGVVPRVTKGAPRTMDEANAIASQQFNEVVPKLKQDIGTWAEPNIIAARAADNPEMTDQNLKILNGVVTDWFDPDKLSRLDGEGLKHLDSQLGYLIRKYAGGSPADKTLADELRNVQGAYRDNLNRLLPENMRGYEKPFGYPKDEKFTGPVKPGALTQANTTWARLVPINKASSQRADEAITPRALQRALASQARQDVSRMPPDVLVDNAVKVLPSNVPDSGTAGRLILGASGLGTAGMTGTLLPYLGAGAGAYLGATRPVQRALTGNTALQKALQPYDPQVAAALAAALRGGQQE